MEHDSSTNEKQHPEHVLEQEQQDAGKDTHVNLWKILDEWDHSVSSSVSSPVIDSISADVVPSDQILQQNSFFALPPLPENTVIEEDFRGKDEALSNIKYDEYDNSTSPDDVRANFAAAALKFDFTEFEDEGIKFTQNSEQNFLDSVDERYDAPPRDEDIDALLLKNFMYDENAVFPPSEKPEGLPTASENKTYSPPDNLSYLLNEEPYPKEKKVYPIVPASLGSMPKDEIPLKRNAESLEPMSESDSISENLNETVFIPRDSQSSHHSKAWKNKETVSDSPGGYSIAKKERHEDESDPAWYRHKLHLFIFTYSGKPVFSRYGDEEALSAFTGTLSAITSKISSLFAHSHDGDVLRYMMAGDHCFAFLERGPLWVACISSQGESYRYLVQLMEGVYLQILSLLTKSIERTLNLKPSYDLRLLLGGTDAVFSNFITWHCEDLFPLVDGFESLPLNSTKRAIASSILKYFKTPNIFAGIIFAQHRIVAMSCAKSLKLKSSDIILLLNLLLSTTSLRQSESWTPICLPGLDDSAFLYAYINFFLPESIGFVCLSSNSSAEQFFALSTHFKIALAMLTNTGCISAITQSLQYCPYSLPSRIWGFLDLIHLLFYSPIHHQYFSTAFGKNYKEKVRYKRVFRLYYQCRELIDVSKSPAHAYIKGKDEAVYVWIAAEFHLYMCTPSWKDIPTTVLARLVQWLKKQTSFLFATDMPVIKT